MGDRTYGYRDARVFVNTAVYENAFGVAEATPVNREYYVNTPPPEINKQRVGNHDGIGIGDEPTQYDELTRDGRMTFNVPKVFPDFLAFIFAYGLGTIVTSTPEVGKTARLHTITRNTASNVLRAFTMERILKSGAQKQYTGCFIERVTLRGSRGGWWEADVTVICKGTVTTGTGTGSAVSELFLSPGITKVFKSTDAYDGTQSQDKTTADLASAVNASPPLMEFEYSFENQFDLDQLREFDSGLYIASVERDNFQHSANALFEYRSDDPWWDHYVANDQLSLELECHNTNVVAGDAVSTYQGFNLIFPKVEIARATFPEGREKQTIRIEFEILKDATYGSILMAVYNAQTQYMQAS